MIMSRLMPLRHLVACKDLTCTDRHFYAAAWALFTYLMNVKKAKVTTYMQLIETTNLDELEAEMKRWLVSGSHTVLHYNVRFPTYAVSERELRDADVHAVRGLMRVEFQENQQLAKQEIETALALDPTHVLAAFVRYRIDKTISADVARALVAAHPDDWRAHMLLAWAIRDGEEAHAAWVRGCELAAQNPALITKCPEATSR
jgi:hypothetical protein